MSDTLAWPDLARAAGWPAALERERSATEAARACRRITRRRAASFAYAFLLLPGRERRAMHALYAFCRLCDDLADECAAPIERRRAALANVRLRLLAPGAEPPGPVLAALEDAVRRHGIVRDDLLAIVDGCLADLDPAAGRFPNLAAVESYCHLVASAPGLAAIEIFGHRGGLARVHARALGVAMQLTNILRDVREDAALGRVYLPDDWLAAHGCSRAALLAGAPDGDLSGVLETLALTARVRFAEGKRLLPLVRASTRACPAALAALYEALLDRIEAEGVACVLERRVRLPGRQKLAIALGRWMHHGLLGA